MKKNTIVFCLILLVKSFSFAQDVCGTCATPTCKIYGPVKGTSLTDASSKVNWSSIPSLFTYNVDASDPIMKVSGPKTFSNCYTITLSEVTSIGVKIKSVNKSAGVTFSAKLYPISETACLGGSYSPDRTLTVGGTGVPEWDNLAVGSYKMCITINLPASEFIGDMTVAYYTTSTTPPASNNECGTCAIPNCKITHNTTITDATSISNSDYNIADYFVPTTAAVGKVSTCYTLTTDANGTLGVRISEDLQRPDPVNGIAGCSNTEADAIDLTRKYTLVEKNGICPGVIVSPNVTNKAISVTKFNPEWYGLKSNTDYTLCVEVDINQNPTCKLIKLGMVYYHPTSSVPPVPTPIPCGTVGFDWRNTTSQPKPTNTQLSTCVDKDFSLKANLIVTASQYIAPGFDIDINLGDLNLTKIEIDEGGTGYQNTFGKKEIAFCSPVLTYKIRLTGSVNSGGSGIVRIVDHATGEDLFIGPFTTGMEITLAPGKIKGTATFSGPGVSNYKLDAPTAGATTFLGSGYGVFNPFKAGNGTHKIRYDWDNGSGPCGFSEIPVTVSGCTTPSCKVVDIDLYDDDQMTTPHSGLTFNCSSNKLYLGPKNVGSIYFNSIAQGDYTWPFPMVRIMVAPVSGNMSNINFNAYDAKTGNLVESSVFGKAGFPLSADTATHYFAKPDGYTFSLTKTTSGSGNYSYKMIDVMSGTVLGTGTFVISGGGESNKSSICKPTNFKGGFTCATCGTDALIQGIGPQFLDEIGIATFDPKKAGTGSHDIIYTWDNELSGSKHCTSSKTITVNVTGGPTGSATIGDICQGTSPAPLTFSSLSIAPNDPKKFSIDWDASANTAGLRDIVDTTIAASSFKLSKTIIPGTYNGMFSVKNSAGCSSTPVAITLKVMSNPTISPTTAEICVDASISLSGSGGSGTPNATTPWSQENSKVLMSGSGPSRSFKGITAGDCYVVYMDNKGCTDTVTIKVNANPTLTATPTSILVGGTSSVSVSGGSGIGATSNAWKTLSNTANILSGVTGNTQPITVTGVASGNEDVIYTDNKGCDDTVTIAVSIPGCNSITKITSNQTWCQDIDPPALEFSTTETATDGISFIVVPPGFPKPADANAIYAGIVFLKETAVSGKVSLDLPKLGTTGVGAIPFIGTQPVVAGDYYIYAILTNPNTTSCKPFAEIKVTIKDTTSPLITIANTGTLNEYRVTWKDVPDTVSYKVDTVTYVKGNVPTTPNWKSLLPNITANHTLQAPLIFPNIPFGRTLLVQVTPLDVNGVKLSCNSIRENRIDNPSCTKPILEPLNIPDTVCAGVSLDLLKGKINASSVKVNFEWYVSTDSLNWTLISSGGDCLISNTTVNEATDLAIKTKLTMNKSFVRLFGKDVATGQCSDTTLPVKIMVNEIPDATISIFPDPAKLCVGDPKSIEVTFQGSKGLQPYRFDFELDAVAKDTASSNIPGDGKVIKTFKTTSPILDSTFVLKKVTDKNGCFADISNQSVKMEVVALPQPIFQADKTIGCYPLEVIFTDKSAVLNTDVEWDFGNGDLDNTSLGVVKYVFQKSGDYTIKFKSTINGCWDTMQKTNYIHVKDRPVAQFSPKKTNISLIDPEIQFINSSSSNSVYYKWIFGDGSPVSNLVNPKHKYIGEGNNGLPEPGKYLVELYAFINQDCWDSTSTIITIDDEQIFYIPNTFTPNNDERNNTFQPIFTSGFDAQNYHFLIYNRWGELMFESNNSQIGWDGTYGNKLLMNDTYTWKLQFKEKMTEKEHYLTGHVNLIK